MCTDAVKLRCSAVVKVRFGDRSLDFYGTFLPFPGWPNTPPNAVCGWKDLFSPYHSWGPLVMLPPWSCKNHNFLDFHPVHQSSKCCYKIFSEYLQLWRNVFAATCKYAFVPKWPCRYLSRFFCNVLWKNVKKTSVMFLISDIWTRQKFSRNLILVLIWRMLCHIWIVIPA